MPQNLEIERKYLIAMPDEAFLKRQPGCVMWEIVQTYLTSLPGNTRRVRHIVQDGEVCRVYTHKRRIDALAAEETERGLSQEEYDALLMEADPKLRPVVKVRYRIPYESQLVEVDVYPFWQDRAVAEVELESEDQQVLLPEWLHVIRDVTDDARYKNFRLAQNVPMDEI